MNDTGMELDGLTPVIAAGPRGVQGGLLERLEREALAEAAQATAAAAAAASAASAGPSQPGAYVPGAAAKVRKQQQQQQAGPSSPSPSTSTIGSAAPAAATTTTSAQPNGATQAAAGPAEPKIKIKPEQPTIRLQFHFRPYSPEVVPTAKQVPIFNVHELSEKAGLLVHVSEEEDESASSQGGSDDDDDGEAEGEETGADTTVEATHESAAMKAALAIARAKGNKVIQKKRVRDRDEGYDVNDAFVDDSELAINEPKYCAKAVKEGYCVVQGLVDVVAASGSGAKKGRQAGSLNKPKVSVMQPDGSTKMVSEAVAAREEKKSAKAKMSPAAPAVGTSASAREEGDAATASSSTAKKQKMNDGHASESPGPSVLLQREPRPYASAPQSSTASAQRAPDSPAITSRPPASHDGTPGTRTSPIALGDSDDEGENAKGKGKARSSDIPSSTAHGMKTDSMDYSFSNSPAPSSTAAPASTNGAGPLHEASPIPQASNVFSFNASPEKGGKRVYDTQPVSKELAATLRDLEIQVKNTSFLPNKNKFPPSLKPPLVRAAMLAMDKGEYNDNFFNFLPGIFPYNRFTMEKLVKREVCGPRVDKLEADIAATATALKALVDQQMPAMIQAYEANVAAWEAEVAEIQKGKGTSAAPGHESTPMLPNESRQSLTPVGSDGDASMSAPPPASTAEGDALPPKPIKKFKFTEPMRMYLYSIMTSSGLISEAKIAKAEIEKADPPSLKSGVTARYAELVKLWPADWMTSNQLSRELTAAKKKLEKTIASAKQ